MPGDAHRNLIPYLKDTAGDSLRGVAVYDSTGYESLYVRDDVQAEHFELEVDKMIDRLRQESQVRDLRDFPFDELNGTVRSFGEALVMHFPRTRERGTVITFDPEVARQLNTFMSECLQRIEA